jgi:two-component system, OmpR family, phosphate regulon sensor histidine kinase PhoR
MGKRGLQDLADLIEQQAEPILAAWRGRVRKLPAAARLDLPALNDHLPRFLRELAASLRTAAAPAPGPRQRADTAPEHGAQRVEDGLDIEQVVAEYAMLRLCILETADRARLAVSGEGLRTFNAAIDAAIGRAIKGYASEQARELRQQREAYLAFVAHDLRTPLNAVSLAVRILEVAPPQVGGPVDVAHVLRTLRRNVTRLDGLVSSVLEEGRKLEVQAEDESDHRRPIDLWLLVEGVAREVAAGAAVGLRNETPVDLQVFAEPRLLEAALRALLAQAAVTAPFTPVQITASATANKAVELRLSLAGGGAARAWDIVRAPSDARSATSLDQLLASHGASVRTEPDGEAAVLTLLLPPPPDSTQR